MSDAAPATETAAVRASVSGDAARPAGASVSGDTRPAGASVSNGAASPTNADAAARGSVAGRAASPSTSGAAAAEPTKTEEPAAAAAAPERAPTVTAARAPTVTAVAEDATRPVSGSVSGGAAPAEPRPASGSVGGAAATPESRPASGSKLGTVPEDAVAARVSVSKSSPAPAPAAAEPAPTPAAATAPTPVVASGAAAPATGAHADREQKKNNLAGGDKQISVPRPVEDVKRELEAGSLRCTEAWFGKIDKLKELKPEDNSVKYMGFVQDGDASSKQALFYVEAGKKESANAADKPYRLLKLSDLPESKEAVTLMYISSPIVYAAAAGRNDIVSFLIEKFGLDYTKEQSVYTAAWDEASKKWVVDNSQSKHVSASMVGVANGFEEVAHGGCRMCASGDCTIM